MTYHPVKFVPELVTHPWMKQIIPVCPDPRGSPARLRKDVGQPLRMLDDLAIEALTCENVRTEPASTRLAVNITGAFRPTVQTARGNLRATFDKLLRMGPKLPVGHRLNQQLLHALSPF